jgi:hypothetical protein
MKTETVLITFCVTLFGVFIAYGTISYFIDK